MCSKPASLEQASCTGPVKTIAQSDAVRDEHNRADSGLRHRNAGTRMARELTLNGAERFTHALGGDGDRASVIDSVQSIGSSLGGRYAV